MSIKVFSRLAFATLCFQLISLPAFSDSHVRIVRLSYIEGGVQIDRNTGQYEKAILNLPITEGAKLRTASDGRAEVEFEDGGTIRLASSTTVQFSQLLLQDSGRKVSTVEMSNGTLYANSAETRNDNELTVEFGREKLLLPRAARIRVSASDKGHAVAVFKGEVQVEGPSGAIQVKKNQTAEFDSANDQATIAKNIEAEPFDRWDKQQSQYHSIYASNSYTGYSPYAFGTSDLNYYGTFFSAPGYGMLWQPFLVGAAWDPFMNGAWAFSPGVGYGWVSAYPWGWVPYHYGTWVFLPAYGWAWQPGGAWMPTYSQPVVLKPPSGFKPPQAPAANPGTTNTVVTVNRGPVSTFAASSGSKLVIQNNSAGLGVPRGQVANLARASHDVQQRGMVTEHVHPGPTAPAFAPGMSGRSEMERMSGRGPQPRMSAPAAPAPAHASTPSPAAHTSPSAPRR
jgi:hypothetical protein